MGSLTIWVPSNKANPAPFKLTPSTGHVIASAYNEPKRYKLTFLVSWQANNMKMGQGMFGIGCEVGEGGGGKRYFLTIFLCVCTTSGTLLTDLLNHPFCLSLPPRSSGVVRIYSIVL